MKRNPFILLSPPRPMGYVVEHNGMEIPVQPEVKYLGSYLVKKLTW